MNPRPYSVTHAQGPPRAPHGGRAGDPSPLGPEPQHAAEAGPPGAHHPGRGGGRGGTGGRPAGGAGAAPGAGPAGRPRRPAPPPGRPLPPHTGAPGASPPRWG